MFWDIHEGIWKPVCVRACVRDKLQSITIIFSLKFTRIAVLLPLALLWILEEALVAPAYSRAVECALNADHSCHTWFLFLDSEIMVRVQTPITPKQAEQLSLRLSK